MQTEPISEKSLVARWFTEPPYVGVLLIVAFLLGIGVAALTQRPESPGPQVVQVTPPAPPVDITPAPAAPAPSPDNPAPEVSVRPVPSEEPEEKPEPEKTEDDNPAAPEATEGARNDPGVAVNGSPAPPDQPGIEAPVPAPEAPAPVPQPDPEPEQPEFRPMEPPVRAQPLDPPARPRSTFRPPARETGEVTLYFDADSSTFDRRGRRLPLRVEVYVNGRKRLETNDPEKRSFNLGRLEEGEHEIEIIPYVGSLPARARREVIRLSPGKRARYRAVLSRENGVSRIGKFRERD